MSKDENQRKILRGAEKLIRRLDFQKFRKGDSDTHWEAVKIAKGAHVG